MTEMPPNNNSLKSDTPIATAHESTGKHEARTTDQTSTEESKSKTLLDKFGAVVRASIEENKRKQETKSKTPLENFGEVVKASIEECKRKQERELADNS